MSKTGATSELNDENWNNDEEAEEAGNWETATSEAFQGRVILKAQRRIAGENQDEPDISETESSSESEYLTSLRVLNESVITWITDQVEKNTCCVLTPIFQDYGEHLKALESKPVATETPAPTVSFSFRNAWKRQQQVEEVEEDVTFYSTRCKLFYKKGRSYTDKGVGTMLLTRTKEAKTQLVIRAGSSLGNILLNILLNPQITTQRVGKNKVMLVCVPNPPIDAKNPSTVPIPMLLRVHDADELLNQLNRAKQTQ